MNSHLIKNALCVNEGKINTADVLVKNGRIEKIAASISVPYQIAETDASGLYLMPGVIDDQVHFREPGLTHKADIGSESKAAVAGGITTFMEMPNTKPAATTLQLLEEKYAIASRTSYANYSFFMGTTNENYDDLMRMNGRNICGLKIFMGSSTGNMLVDNENVLSKIFSNFPYLIATHCEDEQTVRSNTEAAKTEYGDKATAKIHPIIRNETACYKSSSFAVQLAQKHNTRLHVLHISTADELGLFTNQIPLSQKRITSEVCVHHLWFTSDDYDRLGNKIKCNPAIKDARHAPLLFEAMLDDRLDIIATDHAPHTLEEKSQGYFDAPSGLPLVQHSLLMMLDFFHQGKISLEKIVDKMCHKPAECFRVIDRGYLREGYFADLVLVNLSDNTLVQKANTHYKCGWSPLEGHRFRSSVAQTFINGFSAYKNGEHTGGLHGSRIIFNH